MTTATETLIRMMESLPETIQSQVVEKLREYIEDIQDDLKWDASFKKTQSQLIEAAKQAKKEIAAGNSEPMDYSRL
jgi:hypothetical protein